MWGIEKIVKNIDSLRETVIKVAAAVSRSTVSFSRVEQRLDRLERALLEDREKEREFFLKLFTPLRLNSPVVPQKLPPFEMFDPFKELPLGDMNGYSLEELGINDAVSNRPEAEEKAS